MLVHIFDITEEILSGEVQVQRAHWYAVKVHSNGDIECRCRYSQETGIPCWHAVALIDTGFKESSNSPVWNLTDIKW